MQAYRSAPKKSYTSIAYNRENDIVYTHLIW